MKKVPQIQLENIETSCCGMAGAFGYAQETYLISKEMAEKDLLPQIRQAEENTILIADGTSCRSQIVDLANKNAVHVARLLDKQLTEN